MTVKDLCFLFVDTDFQDIIIYSVDSNKEVFKGTAQNACECEYADDTILSIDNISGSNTEVVTINI